MHRNLTRAAWPLGTALTYYLAALLGLQFAVRPEGVALIWPASGVLLAALLLCPPAARASSAAAALAAGVAAHLTAGESLGVSAALAAASCVEGLAVAWGVQRVLAGRDPLGSLGATLTMLGVMVAATAGVALLGAAADTALQRAPFWDSWRLWWLADSVGMLVVTPALLALASATPSYGRHTQRRLEALLFTAAFLGVLQLIFGTSDASIGAAMPRTYAVFPLLIWAAVRYGARGAALAIMVTAAFAAGNTAAGTGPFAQANESALIRIVPIQVYLAIVAVSTLALLASLEERARGEEQLRASEEQLRASEERLRLALVGGGLGIWDMDIPSGAISWSDQHAALWGMRPGEFDGRYETFVRPIHPDDLAGLEEATARSAQTGAPYQHEYRIIRPDGAVRWVVGRGGVVARRDGKAARLAGTVLDVTERHQAEEERRRYTDRLRTLREIDRAAIASRSVAEIAALAVGQLTRLIPAWRAAMALFDTDREHATLLAVAGAGREIPGLAPGSAMTPPPTLRAALAHGRPLVIPDVAAAPQRADTTDPLIAIGMRSAVTVPLLAQSELIGMLLLGSDRPAGFSAEQIQMAEEVADQLAVAIRQAQLYEEVQRHAETLERHVAERTAALEAANRELEAFSYSVSHDLRAPLRHIDGFVGLLSKREAERLDATSLRYLKVIGDSSRRMGHLIDDLLALSRVGRTELRTLPTDLNAVVATVRDELSPLTSGRQIVWDVGRLPTVQGDPSLLRQAFTNLLENAVKYTAPRAEAHITVHATAAAGEVTIAVRDDGVGFEMEYAHKLFGVFQRLHRDDEFEGTGIGLATVRRIVQRHGGRVWAEGQPGRGAAFFVALPR